jgi:conjugative transposon TraN protein
MKIVLTLLMGSILLNLTTTLSAQPGSSSGQALPQLFSAVARSALADTAVATPGHASSKGVVFKGVAIKGVAMGNPDKTKSEAAISEEALKICCERVENDKRRIYYLSNRNGKMVMQIKGIYTREALLFFHISLYNRSHLDYDMDSLRFFIADKGGLKNIVSKVTELKPVYTYGNMKIIRGKSREPGVIALRRFTLPPGKRLLIEAREKNGGRHLQIQADNNTLVRARLI